MIALDFTGKWCCDRHPGNGFDLASYFPGVFYTEEDDINLVNKRKKRTPKGQNRPMAQRPHLQSRLRAWRTEAHALDPLHSVRPSTFICDDKSIVKLSTMHPDKITCALDITRALDETEEWAEEFGNQVYRVMLAYDLDKAWTFANTNDETSECEEEDEEDEEPEAGLEDEASEVEEEIIPRKRARMAGVPSREPVLVSITNRPTCRTARQ